MPEALRDAPEVGLPDISEATADELLARDRFDVPALVAKADHLFLSGDHRGAAAFYSFAVKCATARGVPDERAAAAASRATALKSWLADRFRHHILSSLDAAGLPREYWPPRFRLALEILLGDRPRDLVYEEFPQAPTSFFYPGLPYVNFVDPTVFAWRKSVEAKFADMREEARALLANTADFSPYITKTSNVPQGDVYGLLDNPDWSSFHLWSNGAPVAENVARCPKIFQTVMDNVPLCHIGRRAPVFMLSLLKSHARIPPHSGMSNIRYLCHLPLVVPEHCWFRVGGETAEWHEGELLVFDDSVEHEAENGSDQDRLVLIFDVWNPHLDQTEIDHIKTMLETVEDYR